MHSKLIATFTLIIALAGGGVACLSLAGDCNNQIIKQIPSPNGKMKAVVFQRDCGATTGFNTQVSVLLSNQQLPDEGGNAFVADNASSGAGGGPFVVVSWTNDTELLITYDKQARVFHNEPSVGNIRVRYETLGP